MSEKTPDPIEAITDFFIPKNEPLNGWYYANDDVIDFKDTPNIYDYVNGLMDSFIKTVPKGKEDFVLHQGPHSYRGHDIVHAIDGNEDYINRTGNYSGPIITLRKIAKFVPELENIGLDKNIVEVLAHPWLSRGGIIVIAGETGNGKSTTCGSTILHRVRKFNKYAFTIEDPPELPLHGRHGKGRVIQTEALDGEFGPAMRGAMRSFPSSNGNILYVGETRDTDTAIELLKASNAGHLVITTTHANDVPAVIKRLSNLATGKLPASEVNDILAANLRLIMHQTLKRIKTNEGTPPKVILQVKFLISYGASSPVAQYIARGKPEHLGTEMDQQANVLGLKGVDHLFAQQQMNTGTRSGI
jgi:Tfp pilus assembly pilus retraction ATPase PilT